MRVAILCGAYYPSFSAVGLCASRIAEELTAEHEVYVLSVTDRIETQTRFTYNGVNVYKATPIWEKRKRQMQAAVKDHPGFSKAVTMAYQFRRMLSVVLGKYSVRKDFVSSFRQLLDSCPVPDVILACCMPVESLIAAYEYRRMRPKTIISAMLYDGFSDARTTHYFSWNRKLKLKRHIGLERKLYMACKKVFFVHQNKQHLDTYHGQLKDKFVEVEHPNILPIAKPKNVEPRLTTDTTDFVYGGGLKKGYIDPTDFITLIQELPGYKLHIYTSENGMQQFREYHQCQNVAFNGWLSQEDLLRVQYGAEFLINFATSDGHQISSKIFNYISMGRPFIHIYNSPDDSNLRYLTEYPLCLCLDAADSKEANREKLVIWCKKNLGRQIQFEQVSKIFKECTPEYICGIIMEELTENGSKE